MAHSGRFAQKEYNITASRVDVFTDVGGTFGFYVNNVQVPSGVSSQANTVPIVTASAVAVQTTTSAQYTAGTYGKAVASAGSIALPAGQYQIVVGMQITGSSGTGTNTYVQLNGNTTTSTSFSTLQSRSQTGCNVVGVEDAASFSFYVYAPTAWSFVLNVRQDNAAGTGTAGYTSSQVQIIPF